MNKGLDFGWGAVVNFQKKMDQSLVSGVMVLHLIGHPCVKVFLYLVVQDCFLMLCVIFLYDKLGWCR